MDFMWAFLYYFIRINMFAGCSSDLAEINNLLKFIRVNKKDREYLIQKSLKEKNLEELISFLQEYDLNFKL